MWRLRIHLRRLRAWWQAPAKPREIKLPPIKVAREWFIQERTGRNEESR